MLTCPSFLHPSLFIYHRERELRDIGLLLNEGLDPCSYCPTPEFDNSVKVIQDLRFHFGTKDTEEKKQLLLNSGLISPAHVLCPPRIYMAVY